MNTSIKQTTIASESDNGYISSESHLGISETNGIAHNNRRSLKSEIFDNFAKRPVGQLFLRTIDRFLWNLEKTIAWMEPKSQLSEGVFGPVLVTNPERPMPWILFLPGLLFIRSGFILNGLLSKVLNYKPITPQSMIKSIQRQRRRFRYIKYVGKRALNSNQPNGINKNEHPGGEISIFVKIIFWPYFLIKHIVHFFGFDAETPSPPRSPMYLNSPKFIQEKKRKLSDLNEPNNGTTCTVVAEDSGEEDEALTTLSDAMTTEWVEEGPAQDPDYFPPTDEESDEVASSDVEENDEDVETLCASSEEDNLRSEKYVSDQPESDLMLIPKITNGNSNSKETVKNDEKGIKEKINLKEEEDVTCSGPNSMSTTPENAPPKNKPQSRNDEPDKNCSIVEASKKQQSRKKSPESLIGEPDKNSTAKDPKKHQSNKKSPESLNDEPDKNLTAKDTKKQQSPKKSPSSHGRRKGGRTNNLSGRKK